MPANRDDHLAWCKRRALAELERGDVKGALTSMCSDLEKHPAFVGIVTTMFPLALLHMMNNDAREARRFIEGFN